MPQAAAARDRRVLQVVMDDNKIYEYSSPMLVKDMLMHFPGYALTLSSDPLQPLAAAYRLETGGVYYLLPLDDHPVRIASPSLASASVDLDRRSGTTKRIKVVITRKQLKDLLLKKLSVKETLSGLPDDTWDKVHPSVTRWEPLLETIPEGSE